jgi:hypothetical protein
MDQNKSKDDAVFAQGAYQTRTSKIIDSID